MKTMLGRVTAACARADGTTKPLLPANASSRAIGSATRTGGVLGIIEPPRGSPPRRGRSPAWWQARTQDVRNPLATRPRLGGRQRRLSRGDAPGRFLSLAWTTFAEGSARGAARSGVQGVSVRGDG